jgi:hypothetical protein
MIIGLKKDELEFFEGLRAAGLSDITAISYLIDTHKTTITEIDDDSDTETDTESMDQVLSVPDEQEEPEEAEA